MPLKALPWLALAAVACGLAVWLAGPLVALLTADRWATLGLRLAFGLLAALPFVAMTAPGVVYGHSVPGYAAVALRGLAIPHLTLWRSVPPCEPAPPGPLAHAAADDWGSDREEWNA